MGVKGRLRDMSLVDIVQIFGAEKKTAAIYLGSELGYGKVYMKDGLVVHAAFREHRGAEAFYALLSWEDGEFDVDTGAVSPERTINEQPEGLILEGLRRLDESRGRGGSSGAYAGDMESIKLINKLLELKILEKTR